MKVNKCLLIWTVLCPNIIANIAGLSSPYSSLIFDLTRPVNELIDGNVSREDFFSNVHSAFSLIGKHVTTSTIFYATAGETFKELEEETFTACKIINETLERIQEAQLLVSWTVNESTIDDLSSNFLSNGTLYGCKPKLFLHFQDESDCSWPSSTYIDKLEKLLRSRVENNWNFVGIGLDESLIGCELVERLRPFTDLFLVSMKFGKTDGVTESFGLFRTRMQFLNEKMLDFISRQYFPNAQFLYYPNPNSVGDDKHRHLLMEYSSFWEATDKTQSSIVLQMPNFKSLEAKVTTNFSITLQLHPRATVDRSSNEELLWSLLMFTTSFHRQPSIIISDYRWKLWNSQSEVFFRTHKIPKLDSPIHIILDCSIDDCYSFSINTPQPLRSYLNGSQLSTIVFEVGGWRSSKTQIEVARLISPAASIGCIFHRIQQKSLNESDAEHAVRECQKIGGSIYILMVTVKVEWYNEIGQYSFYFENTVREELHAVNRFRKDILQKAPMATVYFELVIEETRRPPFRKPLLNSNSMFCDEIAQPVNSYLEGIVNWARLEEFPLVITLIANHPIQYFLRWFSLMRRLNPPNRYLAENKHSKLEQNNTVTNPDFSLQSYLKSILNWELDMCIDWTEKRWEIEDNFFHNPKIGTSFHPQKVVINKTRTNDEYFTMLRFVLHRFRLVEISVGSDFRNIFSAIEKYLATEVLETNTEIFVNFVLPAHDRQMDLSAFMLFVSQLKESQLHEKRFVSGVHTELVVDSRGINETENVNPINLESLYKMMKYVKQLNISCGISSSMKRCSWMLDQFDSTGTFSEIMVTINYIVCKEHFKTLRWSNVEPELQTRLDGHLLIKRIMHQLAPQLKVYFRVEMDFEIGESNATLDIYTNFLALFKTFGTAYDISYFIENAFDNQFDNTKNGWWGITNYSDLTNPKSYGEKVTILRGRQMWFPSTLPNITLPEHQDFVVTIVSSVSSVVVLLLFIVAVCFGLRYRKLRHLNKFLSTSEAKEFLNGTGSANTGSDSMEMELMCSIEQTEFSSDYMLDLSDLSIDIEKKLGSGTFGTVYKGLTKDIVSAIKRPNRDCSKDTFKSFLAEVKVLSYIGRHQNVVGFLGAYVNEISKGVLYIATELCAGGSLESFLRKKVNVIDLAAPKSIQHIEQQSASLLYYHDLNTFAMEIAAGMEYIEKRRVVHGDLSARNVLLDENLVCKIADFGLSRKLNEYQKYVKTSQEPLPWKWMAHESLAKMEFTSKSDVWGYGVTLWEIYSLGKIPYGGLSWSVDFANDLQNGLRLHIPDFASKQIYAQMKECWNLNPDERPTFTDFVNFYKSLNQDAYTILNPTE